MAFLAGLGLGGATAGLAQAVPDTAKGAVRAVDFVDLTRYAGRWYEVARFPNRFQRRCACETTAEYELLANGQMRVINSCRQADGRLARVEGRARAARADGPASELKVRFAPAFLSFLSIVWADYWILDVTPEYDAALVGTPTRELLWILSRTPAMADSTYQRMVDTARAQGFDVTRLTPSMEQEACPRPADPPP